MSAIEVKNVSFSYDKSKKVLDNVSLSVGEGECVAILGANGSGKSTLAKIINGLLTPDSGEVSVFGLTPKDKRSLYEIRKKVGVVFQNPDNQLVATIVSDDVAFGPENLGLSREEIGKRIDFALKSVDMEEFRNSSAERLSGGQKQRVAIAGVLAIKPEILILDESTAMLDPVGREEILKIVKKLKDEQNVTVIMITHFMEEVTFADKIIVLNNGKNALSGTPTEIFSRAEELRELGLEVPTPTLIAEALIKKGIPLKKHILTREELKEELCALKHKI